MSNHRIPGSGTDQSVDAARRKLVLGALAGGAAAAAAGCAVSGTMQAPTGSERRVPYSGTPSLILHNGRITTLGARRPVASAVAIDGGRFVAVGSDSEVLRLRGESTRVIDLRGRTALPGLNDSHTHLIRGGLNYNLELRWDGLTSLAEALRRLRAQARVTPPPQWVRVVGGWSEFQFRERRMPTLRELNQAAPDTPVFVLHLYDRALLNAAALRAVGYTRDTPDPPGGVIERDKRGNPTGLLIAQPNALILYSTLAKGPKLSLDHQVNSTRHFMRELNRLGVTSVVDAGGGFQNYPQDYQVVDQLHRDEQLTVRIAYNLFTQNAKRELDDFSRWAGMVQPYDGTSWYRMNGAGEMLVFSAADFEDFLQPRPDLPPNMEQGLEGVVRLLVRNRWPFRIHATYDESIARCLDVFERVNRDLPLGNVRWLFDHAETVSARSLDRVAALGGGIAIQHRMAFQGEYFRDRYGEDQLRRTPPVVAMLSAGIPVGCGTDATRVASYNPWVALYWLVSGKTLGGLQMYDAGNRLDRHTALRLWTGGSAWVSREETHKGAIEQGFLADLIVPSADYFAVPDEQIKDITSLLTVVDGRIVHGDGDFKSLAPPLPPASPDWSPVRRFGGYAGAMTVAAANHRHDAGCSHRAGAPHPSGSPGGLWGVGGCACAFA